MPNVKKYTDWRTWWDGLRTNLLKCIGTTGTLWLGTNAAAGAGIPIKGIDWEQAGLMFGVHIGFEVFSYLKDNQPKVITETVETSFISKSPDGSTVTQGSKVTTETPAKPNP